MRVAAASAATCMCMRGQLYLINLLLADAEQQRPIPHPLHLSVGDAVCPGYTHHRKHVELIAGVVEVERRAVPAVVWVGILMDVAAAGCYNWCQASRNMCMRLCITPVRLCASHPNGDCVDAPEPLAGIRQTQVGARCVRCTLGDGTGILWLLEVCLLWRPGLAGSAPHVSEQFVPEGGISEGSSTSLG
jgi:hypothetical protein